METKTSPKPLDAYELIKLMTDTVEFICRMQHFYESVLRVNHDWLTALPTRIDVCPQVDPGDTGIMLEYEDYGSGWELSATSVLTGKTELPALKQRFLELAATLIKLDYYVCVGLDGEFEPDLHKAPASGMSGKLYLAEVVTTYEKALLKYAKDN